MHSQNTRSSLLLPVLFIFFLLISTTSAQSETHGNPPHQCNSFETWLNLESCHKHAPKLRKPQCGGGRKECPEEYYCDEGVCRLKDEAIETQDGLPVEHEPLESKSQEPSESKSGPPSVPEADKKKEQAPDPSKTSKLEPDKKKQQAPELTKTSKSEPKKKKQRPSESKPRSSPDSEKKKQEAFNSTSIPNPEPEKKKQQSSNRRRSRSKRSDELLCGLKIAPCPLSHRCVPRETSCSTLDHCTGTCQPKPKSQGHRAQAQYCLTGKTCVDHPYDGDYEMACDASGMCDA